MARFKKLDRRDVFALSASQCCNAPLRLTESRTGGMIATGCTACGEPKYIGAKDIPAVVCTQCKCVTNLTYDKCGSYKCQCECGAEFLLVQVLPEWSLHFERHG